MTFARVVASDCADKWPAQNNGAHREWKETAITPPARQSCGKASPGGDTAILYPLCCGVDGFIFALLATTAGLAFFIDIHPIDAHGDLLTRQCRAAVLKKLVESASARVSAGLRPFDGILSILQNHPGEQYSSHWLAALELQAGTAPLHRRGICEPLAR